MRAKQLSEGFSTETLCIAVTNTNKAAQKILPKVYLFGQYTCMPVADPDPKGRKKIFLGDCAPPPPLSQGLDDRPPPVPPSEGLDLLLNAFKSKQMNCVSRLLSCF